MKKYRFSEEEKEEIRLCREKVQDKKADRRLRALEMRAEGKRNKEIREETGFHVQYITKLVSRYKADGIKRITESRYPRTRRNLNIAESE